MRPDHQLQTTFLGAPLRPPSMRVDPDRWPAAMRGRRGPVRYRLDPAAAPTDNPMVGVRAPASAHRRGRGPSTHPQLTVHLTLRHPRRRGTGVSRAPPEQEADANQGNANGRRRLRAIHSLRDGGLTALPGTS